MNRLLAFWWIAFIVSAALAIKIATAGRIVDLKITKAFHDIGALKIVVETFREKTGSLPNQHQGLQAVVGVDLGFTGRLDELPSDPWSNSYLYSLADNPPGFLIYSAGANGLDERGSGDDVTSSKKTYECRTYGTNCPPTAMQILEYVCLSIVALSLLAGMWRSAASIRRHRNARPTV